MELMSECTNTMKWFEKSVLRSRVLPAIILFALTPRSAYYLIARIRTGLFFFILFALIDAAYIACRLIIVFKHKEDNVEIHKVVLDSAILILGIISSCWFQSAEKTFSIPIFVLSCCAAIPAFINNYMFIKRVAHVDCPERQSK